MDTHHRCGAASPLIYALHDADVIDFCGAFHDTRHLRKVIPRSLEEAQQMAQSRPADLGLYGTALMLRTAALESVGLLNEDYFA
jgi:GT2 family glycosyltransferase